MNIVVFSHGGGSPYHGPNMRWYYLAQALVNNGVTTNIVSASWFHKYKTPPDTAGKLTLEHIDGIKYWWIRVHKYQSRIGQVLNQLTYTLGAFKSVPRIASEKPVDVVIVSSPHPLAILAGRRMARRKRCGLIFEVRDLWPLIIRELSGASAYHPYMILMKGAERLAVRSADRIVSVKPGDKDYFSAEYRFPSDRFTYLPNGFYLDQAQESQTKLLVQGSFHTFVVGYVGALSSYYGIADLIRAADRLSDEPDLLIRIVGGGEDLHKMRSLVSSLRLKNVEFTGPVPKAEVPDYLHTFDVCYLGLKDVSANRYGISCNKLFEYMYAGKPIVGSYATDYDPIAAAECGISVEPGNPDRVAAAIQALRKDPELRVKMGQNGRRYFLKHHDFSVVGQAYFNLLENLRR